MELFCKLAEDVRYDGRQWVVVSGGEDPRVLGEYPETVDRYKVKNAGAITHNIDIIQRLIDILRSVVRGKKIIISFIEIRSLLDHL